MCLCRISTTREMSWELCQTERKAGRPLSFEIACGPIYSVSNDTQACNLDATAPWISGANSTQRQKSTPEHPALVRLNFSYPSHQQIPGLAQIFCHAPSRNTNVYRSSEHYAPFSDNLNASGRGCHLPDHRLKPIGRNTPRTTNIASRHTTHLPNKHQLLIYIPPSTGPLLERRGRYERDS